MGWDFKVYKIRFPGKLNWEYKSFGSDVRQIFEHILRTRAGKIEESKAKDSTQTCSPG